jgi:predicted RNA-binding Zn ribbon-like protein
MERKRQDAPGELEHIRAFINTYDVERGTDELTSAAALTRWLAARGLISDKTRATGEDVRSAIELREALRQILVAHTEGDTPPAGAWEVVDEAARRSHLRVMFGPKRGAALVSDVGGAAQGIGRLLAIVHDSIADGTWPRMKACKCDDCRWAFYDHTKNRSGSWCTMQVCGNREKARAFRARARGD